VTWKGDHSPRHVHVYKDAKLVVKFDLENQQVMRGKVTKRLMRIIWELQKEGLL